MGSLVVETSCHRRLATGIAVAALASVVGPALVVEGLVRGHYRHPLLI